MSLLLPAALTGCIEADDTYTFYLERDGGVQVVVSRDRVASSSSTPVEREKEEKGWLKEFRSGKTDLHKRFKESGAKKFEAHLVRDRRPFVATYRGSYDGAEGLARFFEMKKPEPEGKVELVTSDEHPGRRKLLFTLFKSRSPSPSPTPSAAPHELSGAEARATLKFVAAAGRIVGSRHCAIQADGQACLLDLAAIDRESHQAQGETSFWVEWDISR